MVVKIAATLPEFLLAVQDDVAHNATFVQPRPPPPVLDKLMIDPGNLLTGASYCRMPPGPCCNGQASNNNARAWQGHRQQGNPTTLLDALQISSVRRPQMLPSQTEYLKVPLVHPKRACTTTCRWSPPCQKSRTRTRVSSTSASPCFARSAFVESAYYRVPWLYRTVVSTYSTCILSYVAYGIPAGRTTSSGFTIS